MSNFAMELIGNGFLSPIIDVSALDIAMSEISLFDSLVRRHLRKDFGIPGY